MKNIFFFFIFLSLNFTLFAQVDELKRKSSENKSNKDNSDNDRNRNSSLGDECGGACLEATCDIFTGVLVQAMMEHQSYVLNNVYDNDKTLISLDLMPHVAYGINKNFVSFLPRVRGTFGIFAIDGRLNYITEYKNYSVNVFNTWDVNFNFNIVPNENFKTMLGAGVFIENNSDTLPAGVYSELYLGFELSETGKKTFATLEGRWVPNSKDPESDIFNVFWEINFRGHYRFLKFSHLFGYVTAGINYQRYYSSVNLMTIQAGLTFNIH